MSQKYGLICCNNLGNLLRDILDTCTLNKLSNHIFEALFYHSINASLLGIRKLKRLDH